MSIILEKNKHYRQLHKFGGSSLADPNCFRRVTNIILHHSTPGDIIVVSASGKTTNQLIGIINAAKNNDHSIKDLILEISDYQIGLIKNLLDLISSKRLIDDFNKDLKKLKLFLNMNITKIMCAEIIGYGEIWSARLISALLNKENIPSSWFDSRDFLVAENLSLPQIKEKISSPLLNKIIHNNLSKRLIITGFICRDEQGNTILLGRNGSDYSATQIGYLANVDCITIWSDVSGVYTADPKKVSNTILLSLLKLEEANELARLAAPVLHTRTLQPIINSKIKLKLKSSFNPDKGSTMIKNYFDEAVGAKILTYHEDIYLIKITVLPKNNFLEINKKIISLLKKFHIYPLAMKSYPNKNIFKLCYTSEVINNVLCILKKINLKGIIFAKKKNFSLIAIVGSNINLKTLHIQKFLQHIKDMNLEFTWQSENNISLVAIINGKIDQKVIQNIHNDLFIVKKRIGLVLFGKGNIGSRWLELFNKQHLILEQRNHCECILAGIISSSQQLLEYSGIDLNSVLLHTFLSKAVTKDTNQLFLWMKKHPFNELVVIDITASLFLSKKYLYFAKNKFHVISANKLAVGAFSTHMYKKIKDTFIKNNCYWLYNATVGAGLPINYTIRDLCDSGDTILSISGIFSGTLSWLFMKFDGLISFTELVKIAWQNGLTEPDPRVDLSGKDVTRKLVTLAREAGYLINPREVNVESIISKEHLDVSLDNFFKNSKKLNLYMLKKLKQAKQKNLVLRYIARFNAKTQQAKVGIEFLELNHPLSILRPNDNVFSIESKWYKENSIIIRGPGAGRNVTAGAIQSDLNRLMTLLT